ncbi:MAG: hypothetical protein Devi2KO_01410 [Devosia indica]
MGTAAALVVASDSYPWCRAMDSSFIIGSLWLAGAKLAGSPGNDKAQERQFVLSRAKSLK